MSARPQPVVRVVDADDPRVAEFRDIRERDLVGRRGRFIAEGRVVLAMLARSRRFEAEKILVLDGWLEGLADVLAQFDAATPVYSCDRAVIDRIAGFPMHRSVLAAGRARHPETVKSLLAGCGKTALALVCSGISNHDNLGGLFRNAAAFGADFVCLDGQCCDPLYRKAIRVSVGTALTMPYAQIGAIEDAVSALDQAKFDVLALSPGGETTVQAFRPGNRTALLVGTRVRGFPRRCCSGCRRYASRRSRRSTASINRMAAGIALHAVGHRDEADLRRALSVPVRIGRARPGSCGRGERTGRRRSC